MRLIDVDALMTWFNDHYDHEEFSVGYIAGIINEQPTVEPQRMTGRWIRSDDNTDGKYWECSVCHDEFIAAEDAINNFHFCPTCGAKMGEQNEDD